MTARYDTIGVAYDSLRLPDPRIEGLLHAALGPARTVVNVGAGTGSYEPKDRQVVAVEPSLTMIRQRPATAAPVVRAMAEALPFADGAFDAAMASLTVHHWTDQAAGLRELRRVTRGPVAVLTFDPAHRPWLTDYLPELAALDTRQMPPIDFYARWLGPVDIAPVRIPHDCTDGFLYAYWRRPAAYLDPRLRAGSSAFWVLSGIDAGLAQLQADLDSGAWSARYADIIAQDSYDAGYRLIVTREGK